ncbi:MAG TPA: hypothetical protein VN456_11290 [Desulfosporosinus sp.]|nr:hypothetical protein [Desulfosporosinus sp.]
MNRRMSDTRDTIDKLLQELELNVELGLEITASLCKCGVDLGKAIREHVKLQGLELNLGSFMANYGQVPSHYWETCITQCGIDKYRISHCPDADYCPYIKNVQLGNMLCQLDHAILNGFDPDLEVKLASSMKLGSYSFWFESEITL